ncbi:MAG: hypothetical protein Q9227_005865 [Pyrenula ochraceoflavens]
MAANQIQANNSSFLWPNFYDVLRESLAQYWSFHVSNSQACLGLVPGWVVKQMPWTADWVIREQKKQIVLQPATTGEVVERDMRDHAMAFQLNVARQEKIFKVLEGWRDEKYPVFDHDRTVLLSMERAGSALFGIVTYGVHMTAYVKKGREVRIWVPRRAQTKQTYPGYLDNTVAGGISTGEIPFECLVREAGEEASLPEKFVRNHAIPCGTVTYFLLRDANAGGETGLCQPECQYVYDLELPDSIIPAPDDNEAENFELLSVGEVQEALAAGRFKPNCALVLLDFFIRHGLLTAETDKDYIEIVSRLHRCLPFPMR